MKVFAIILVIMVIAALVGVGFLYFNSTLTATFASVIVTDPVTQQDAFDQLKSSLDAETFIGTRFSTSILSSPENYLFYTWTVHLENKSFLPVDSIEIQITPMSEMFCCTVTFQNIFLPPTPQRIFPLLFSHPGICIPSGKPL